MSRVLDRALRPADAPAPVRPRLPALFEPGLDLMRVAAGPEQLFVPEIAGERDHQDNPEVWNGSSWLPRAAPDLAGGAAQGAKLGAPRTSPTSGHRLAAAAIRVSAPGGAPDRAPRSTRLPDYPVRPANGTDLAGHPFAGPPAPGAAAPGAAVPGAAVPGPAAGRSSPAADAAGWPPATTAPLAPGAGEVTPAGAARACWPAPRADSPEPGSARDPARAMMVPLAQRPPAPGQQQAAAPRLHREASQRGAGQHGAGWDPAGWDSAGQPSAHQGSPRPGGAARGGVHQGAAEPVVRISIGRVEIHADRADAPRPSRPASRPRQPALDLAEYLRRRGGQR